MNGFELKVRSILHQFYGTSFGGNISDSHCTSASGASCMAREM